MEQSNKLFTFCNGYIFLWLIYNLQSLVFGGKGGAISTPIIVLLIGISAYHFVYALSHYKLPGYMKGLVVLVVMFTIYGIILIISGKTIMFMRTRSVVKNYNFIKNIYISLLPIFSFYVFTRKGKLTKEVIQKWTLLFFIAAILQFFQNQRELLMMAEEDTEEFTNNYGYVFLSIIPLFAFWEHKRMVQYIGLGLSMVFIILGMKRGAIIIGALSIVWFMFQSMKNASRKQKIWVFILSVILVVVGFYLVSLMLQNSEYFNQRLEDTIEGNSSGRDRLYGVFWQHFTRESNPWLFLFGNGANATLTISSNYAHNDWLEIAINHGLLGLVIYVVYWIKFYKTWKKSKFDSQIYLAVGLILFIFFMKTLFSMSYSAMPIYATLCLGYCMGMISENNNAINIRYPLSTE